MSSTMNAMDPNAVVLVLVLFFRRSWILSSRFTREGESVDFPLNNSETACEMNFGRKG